MRHAEILEPSGDLHTAALRSAKATDVYILGGDGEHTLEPRFTFHGFQHAEVTGAEVVSATAVAISSDLAERSTLETSSEALNRFHSNVRWSQRDNFVSVPTDCPQRDERLGWTGDAQAFAATASTLADAELIDWVYRTVAGLAPAEPGYRVARIAPRPSARLDRAAAAIDTPYGRLAIDWRLEDGELRATLEVPVGVRAALDLPTTEASAVTVDGGPAPEILGSGTHEVTVAAPAVAA